MEKPLVTATAHDYALESEPLGRRIDVSDPKVTGVISGGLLQYTSTTQFTYTAGTGVLHDVQDSSKSTGVSWSAPASPITRAPATPNALLVVTLQFPGPTVIQREIQNFTVAAFRSELLLGTIELDNSGTIASPDAIVPQVIPANGFPFSFLDFLSATSYSTIESGFILGPNGANVMLDLSEGVLFSPGANFHNSAINPNLITLPEWKPLKFNSILADGSVVGTQIQNVDTAQFDIGIGALGPLPAGRWVGHVFFQDISGTVFMQYGQIDFPSLAALLTNFVDVMTLFIYAEQFNKYAVSLGAVLFVSGETDFSNPTQTVILDRTYFGPNGRLWRDARSVNTVSLTPPDETGNVPLSVLQDQTDDSKFLAINFGSVPTATAVTWTIPNASGVPVLEDNTATLTNKTINAPDNTLTNITDANIAVDRALWPKTGTRAHWDIGPVQIATRLGIGIDPRFDGLDIYQDPADITIGNPSAPAGRRDWRNRVNSADGAYDIQALDAAGDPSSYIFRLHRVGRSVSGLGVGDTAIPALYVNTLDTRVGIGTGSPDQALHIPSGHVLLGNSGAYQASRNTGAASVALLGFESGTDNVRMTLGGSTSDDYLRFTAYDGSALFDVYGSGQAQVRGPSPGLGVGVKPRFVGVDIYMDPPLLTIGNPTASTALRNWRFHVRGADGALDIQGVDTAGDPGSLFVRLSRSGRTLSAMSVGDPAAPTLLANTLDGRVVFDKVAGEKAEFNAGASGTAKTIDWNDGSHQRVQVTANCTFTFSGPTGIDATLLVLTFVQDGGFTVTMPASVVIGGGTIPPISSGAGSITRWLMHYDGTSHTIMAHQENIS